MKIIFDKYTCPSCGGKTFEAQHEPTEFSLRRGFTNPNGYADFFYGRCECGYDLNLSQAIVQEYGTREADGRYAGPYPCLALERAFVEPNAISDDPAAAIIHYAYECSHNRRQRGKPDAERIAFLFALRDRAIQAALNFAGQTISSSDGTYETLIDSIVEAMTDGAAKMRETCAMIADVAGNVWHEGDKAHAECLRCKEIAAREIAREIRKF